MSQHDDRLEQLPDDLWDNGDEDPAAEDAAMHVIRDAPVSSMYDPGESELESADPATDPVASQQYFDDEEPEGGRRVAADDDRTPDLEELLEVEHYAFPSEDTDEDAD
jgi:hypothetical protein